MSNLKNNIPPQDNGHPTAKKNALTHGFFASDIVLPWESREEFDELHRQHREEYNPHGASEDSVVEQITLLHWLKRRLVRGYSRRFVCDPLAPDLTAAAEHGADGIEAYLRDRLVGPPKESKRGKLYSEFSTILKKLATDEALQKAIRDESDAIRMATRDGAPQTVSPEPSLRELEERTERALSEALKRIGCEELVEAQVMRSTKPSADRIIEQSEMVRANQAILDHLDRPNDLDGFLKRLASLDAQIQKAIARLMGIKEYKRLYGTKSVDQDGASQT